MTNDPPPSPGGAPSGSPGPGPGGGGGVGARILGWLRAGYPVGVPVEDYIPLLGVLHRNLTDDEVDAIAADLVGAADLVDAGSGTVTEERIRALISERAYEQASAHDVARVSARLAEGGWPLALASAADGPREATTRDVPTKEVPTTDGSSVPGDERATAADGRIARIVGWLREGYPMGVPDTDYIPLVALLRRRLTDDEVRQVAKTLRVAGIEPVGPADIGVEITRVTNELPSPADVARVHDRLAATGWPLDFPDPGT